MVEVSAGNPCPFLRALVEQGSMSDGVEPVADVTRTIVRVAGAGDGSPKLPPAAIRAITLIANGLTPPKLARTARRGLRLDRLRNGPLDKKGAGSRILDARAEVVEAELARLDDFAGDKPLPDGTTERGLDLAEITRYMDANFERAAGHRRAIDRKLMNGEWPILLQVMGRDGADGRYLSLAEVRDLFVRRRLPQRMRDRLAQTPAGD